MSLYIYLHIFIVEGAAVSEVSIPRHNHLQSSSYHISDLRPVSMDLSSSVRQSPPNSQKNNIIVRLKNSSVLLICKLYYQILKAHTFLMSDAALHLLFGSVEGWYVMQFNSALLWYAYLSMGKVARASTYGQGFLKDLNILKINKYRRIAQSSINDRKNVDQSPWLIYWFLRLKLKKMINNTSIYLSST